MFYQNYYKVCVSLTTWNTKLVNEYLSCLICHKDITMQRRFEYKQVPKHLFLKGGSQCVLQNCHMTLDNMP